VPYLLKVFTWQQQATSRQIADQLAVTRQGQVGERFSLDSREACCARLWCCPGSDNTMNALVTDGSVTPGTADLN